MDGTTKEQDKIRRGTLLISLLLLVCSLGSYFVYQHFYQPELHVSFVSKKILPNTGSVNKTTPKQGKTKVEKRSSEKNERQPELRQDLFNQRQVKRQTNQVTSSAKIFKLSDRLGSLPK